MQMQTDQVNEPVGAGKGLLAWPLALLLLGCASDLAKFPSQLLEPIRLFLWSAGRESRIFFFLIFFFGCY